MKLLHLIFLLMSMIFIQSCSSYNVRPVSEDIIWKNGKGFVKNQTENLILQVAVDYIDSSNQRFLIEIENTSSKELLIEPQAFFITDSKGQMPVAINPEDEINILNRQIETRKEILDTKIYDLTDSMLGITLTIASRKDGDLDQRVAQREKEQTEARDEILYLEQQKRDVETSAIRKTILPPGGKINGFLKFQSELASGDLKFVLKSDEHEISVPFKVTQI